MKKFMLWSLLSAIAVDAFAFSEKVDGTTWYYDLTADGAIIQNDKRTIKIGEYEVYVGGTYSGALVTPKKLGGDLVVGIEEWAFYNCTNLTSLTIGEGVASIGDYAFSGSTNLTTISVPTTVTRIGQLAFNGCPLATVNVGKGETARVSALLAGAGVSVAGISFVEPRDPIKEGCYLVVLEPGEGSGEEVLLQCPVDLVKALPAECPFTAPKDKKFVGWVRKDVPRRYDPGMLFFKLAEAGKIVWLTAIYEK